MPTKKDSHPYNSPAHPREVEYPATRIVFENDDILIVNKVAGLPCHGIGMEDASYNLLHRMAEKYPEILEEFPDDLDGGLCHRLDNDTSGLIIIARHPKSKLDIMRMLRNGEIKKTYRAMVRGIIPKDLILNGPIAHHPKSKKRMVVVDQKGTRHRGSPRPSMTIVRPINQEEWHTRIEVLLIGPGARHQIRVHLARAGYPLVGDTLYGKQMDKSISAKTTKHLLHAYALDIPEIGRFTADEPF